MPNRKFQVVLAYDKDELEQTVTDLLNHGWVCQGDVHYTVREKPDSNFWHQAMIYHEWGEEVFAEDFVYSVN